MDLESDPCCCAGRYWLPRGTGLAEVTDWAWPGGRTPLAGLHQHHVRPGEPDHDRRAGIDVVADSTRQPWLAGLALAAIFLKPQAAFMVPLALLLAGYWRVLVSWLAGTL